MSEEKEKDSDTGLMIFLGLIALVVVGLWTNGCQNDYFLTKKVQCWQATKSELCLR